jgi:hypothetical protein
MSVLEPDDDTLEPNEYNYVLGDIPEDIKLEMSEEFELFSKFRVFTALLSPVIVYLDELGETGLSKNLEQVVKLLSLTLRYYAVKDHLFKKFVKGETETWKH